MSVTYMSECQFRDYLGRQCYRLLGCDLPTALNRLRRGEILAGSMAETIISLLATTLGSPGRVQVEDARGNRSVPVWVLGCTPKHYRVLWLYSISKHEVGSVGSVLKHTVTMDGPNVSDREVDSSCGE